MLISKAKSKKKKKYFSSTHGEHIQYNIYQSEKLRINIDNRPIHSICLIGLANVSDLIFQFTVTHYTLYTLFVYVYNTSVPTTQ